MGLGAKTLPLWLRKRRGKSKIITQTSDVTVGGGGGGPVDTDDGLWHDDAYFPSDDGLWHDAAYFAEDDGLWHDSTYF